MLRLGESLRSVLGHDRNSSPSSRLRPEEIIFPWAKRWFKRKDIRGFNNQDLHNASRIGKVSIGDVLGVRRSGDTEPCRYAYIGPANPFIDEKTGRVNHVLYDCAALSFTESVVVANDIIFWEKAGKAPKELAIRIRKAINQQARPIFP